MNDERFVSCGRLLEDWVKGSGLDARRLANELGVSVHEFDRAVHGEPYAVLAVLVALAVVYPRGARGIVSGGRVYEFSPRPDDKGV